MRVKKIVLALVALCLCFAFVTNMSACKGNGGGDDSSSSSSGSSSSGTSGSNTPSFSMPSTRDAKVVGKWEYTGSEMIGPSKYWTFKDNGDCHTDVGYRWATDGDKIYFGITTDERPNRFPYTVNDTTLTIDFTKGESCYSGGLALPDTVKGKKVIYTKSTGD